MKIKCIVDDREHLTSGKIYEVKDYKVISGKVYYCIKDDSGDYCMYSKDDFSLILIPSKLPTIFQKGGITFEESKHTAACRSG